MLLSPVWTDVKEIFKIEKDFKRAFPFKDSTKLQVPRLIGIENLRLYFEIIFIDIKTKSVKAD